MWTSSQGHLWTTKLQRERAQPKGKKWGKKEKGKVGGGREEEEADLLGGKLDTENSLFFF